MQSSRCGPPRTSFVAKVYVGSHFNVMQLSAQEAKLLNANFNTALAEHLRNITMWMISKLPREGEPSLACVAPCAFASRLDL